MEADETLESSTVGGSAARTAVALTWVAAAVAAVAVVLDVISRSAGEGGVRDAAQWVAIAAAAVAVIALVATLNGGPGQGARAALVAAGLVLLGVGIWMRDHYSVDTLGSPWRVVGVTALGLIALLAPAVVSRSTAPRRQAWVSRPVSGR